MADAQASGACYGNIVWVQVPSPASSFWKCTRKCRNWQTSKTKDLVLVTACGFKSHLPHGKGNRKIPFFISCRRYWPGDRRIRCGPAGRMHDQEENEER